jgi:hypothetical protein
MSKQIPFLFLYRVFNKAYYPCLCLCLGLEQITIIRPRRRISRHFSQILRTEALIFIFPTPYFNFESTSENKFLEIFHFESYSYEINSEVQKTPNLSNLCCGVYKLYDLWLNHNDLLQF